MTDDILSIDKVMRQKLVAAELQYYIGDTIEIIEKYKNVFSRPVIIRFDGGNKDSDADQAEKNAIEEDFRQAIRKYMSVKESLEIEDRSKRNKISVSNVVTDSCSCGNLVDFEILEGDIYVCLICSQRMRALNPVTSYKEAAAAMPTLSSSPKTNCSLMQPKYQYDRRIHFKDTINQYCARQNSNIPPIVYTELNTQFEMYHLLVGGETTPREIRYQHITKDHIYKFLKEMKMTKQNENIQLIYYNLTGRRPRDISHLEEKLLKDFDIISKQYDSIVDQKERKYFIHSQLILYQLLCRNAWKCNKDDFLVLQNLDKTTHHEQLLYRIFSELGWTYAHLK